MSDDETPDPWFDLSPQQRRKSNPFRFWLETYVALQKTSVDPDWVKQYDRMYCQHRGGMMAAALFDYLENPTQTTAHGWYSAVSYKTPSKGKTPHSVTVVSGNMGVEVQLDVLWSPREPATFHIKIFQEQVKVKRRVPFKADIHGGEVRMTADKVLVCWIPAISCKLTVDPSNFYPGQLTSGMDPKHYLLPYPPSRRIVSMVERAIQEEGADHNDPNDIWRYFKG